MSGNSTWSGEETMISVWQKSTLSGPLVMLLHNIILVNKYTAPSLHQRMVFFWWFFCSLFPTAGVLSIVSNNCGFGFNNIF